MTVDTETRRLAASCRRVSAISWETILYYVSVVEEREQFLDALDRHTQTDA
jgi:hypothetical protein